MSRNDDKAKAAPGAIHVEAASTVQGRAATTISVEVDESKLGQQVAGASNAERAVAVVARTQDGRQQWTEEELRSSGQRVTEDAHVIKTFNATVSGPLDTAAAGVAVKVETPAGPVWADDSHQPRAARDADKAVPAKPK